jgi:L-malate glycosyltransferase
VGEANRQRALAHYDEAAMVAAYRQVYGGVLGREVFP